MPDEAKHWWERNAREFQAIAQLPIDVIYGPQVNEEKIQLIGPVAGKHLLEIGCGGAQCGIAFAKQGAIVTGVDIAAAQIEFAKELLEMGPHATVVSVVSGNAHLQEPERLSVVNKWWGS